MCKKSRLCFRSVSGCVLCSEKLTLKNLSRSRGRLGACLGEANERTVGGKMGAGNRSKRGDRRGAGARTGCGGRELGADGTAQRALGNIGAGTVRSTQNSHGSVRRGLGSTGGAATSLCVYSGETD